MIQYTFDDSTLESLIDSSRRCAPFGNEEILAAALRRAYEIGAEDVVLSAPDCEKEIVDGASNPSPPGPD